jgi:RNA polymerase sigma-70 factor (ECF subfamily)
MSESLHPIGQKVDPALLVQTHQVGVWRYLRSLGCDQHEAEDLTQDTFLKVLEKPFQEMGEASARSYLLRVAKHQLIDRRRREGRSIAVENIEQIEEFWNRHGKITGQNDQQDLIDTLKHCLEGLTSRAQTALRMRFEDHSTREQIAEALGIGPHGAKNLMQRAKQQLKQCLDEKQAEADSPSGD